MDPVHRCGELNGRAIIVVRRRPQLPRQAPVITRLIDSPILMPSHMVELNASETHPECLQSI